MYCIAAYFLSLFPFGGPTPETCPADSAPTTESAPEVPCGGENWICSSTYWPSASG